jgi:hypothetical protein
MNSAVAIKSAMTAAAYEHERHQSSGKTKASVPEHMVQ